MERASLRLIVALFILVAATAHAAQRTLAIKDNIGRDWENEPIVWQLTFAPGEWKGSDCRLMRDGAPITAQADVIEKHPDGSVKTAEVCFIVDRLAKDGATTFTLETGVAGPREAAVWLKHGDDFQVLTSEFAGVKVNATGDAKSGPILAVRLPSGKWVGGSRYETTTAKPAACKLEFPADGPVRIQARATTTFDNGRTHAVTVTLWAKSHSIEIEEDFNIGPDDRYKFKEYANDRDELAWEWWSWYGDREGVQETHPNNWIVDLTSPDYHPKQVDYFGDISTDSGKGDMKNRGQSAYELSYAAPRRLEKYLAGHCQWRPDAVLWYATSETTDANADCLAVYTHSVRKWRNPNIYPLNPGITLRTGTNDMRIVSLAQDQKLVVQCPIGLGHRTWAIRPSTRQESLGPRATSPTALTAERVQRAVGLDVTRSWVTDWNMDNGYPRLFVKLKGREAYYARLKGQGIGSPGNVLDTFLRNQNQAGFDLDYGHINKQADEMLKGYVSMGLDNTTSYPGWMLGYWHGIVVAGGVDNLCGSQLCTAEQARELKKKLAILTYCLTSRDAWCDKQINYGWGSMNMPVGRWGGLVVMASTLSDHPNAKQWLKDATRYFNMLLQTEYAPDGTHISCPHYIGASSTSFYAWIALANSGLADDVSKSPAMKNFARYYMQLMTPIDPRWGVRVLLNEGDTRPGSSPFPGILATLFKDTDPELAGQLTQIWTEGGRDVSLGMGIPDALIIDPGIQPRTPRLGPEVFPGFGVFLRYRQLGTPEEAYLAFLAGNFMIDHTNCDQLAFDWNEKGVPLSLFMGDMYVPGAVTALTHNTLCWDLRPEGGPCPGKDKPGCWYTDHNIAWADHAKEPRRHLQIGWDQNKQRITDIRGMTTLATDMPGAALVEGKVDIKDLTEVPTRADFSTLMQAQQSTPLVRIEKPFTWTRRLLYVKAPAAAGMNYIVIRDDLGGFAEHTPFFHYWSLSDDVTPEGQTARFKGQLGVDTDLFVAAPEQVRIEKDSFTHGQCEGVVNQRHGQKYGKAFSETQVAARVVGKKGEGFLVVVFPYKADEDRPAIERWQGGVKVTWKGETHYVLLDMGEKPVDADGIKARASCLVVKRKDDKNVSIALPAGGAATYAKQKLDGKGPLGVEVVNDKVMATVGKDLLPK